MKKHLNLIALALWLISVADAAICVSNPNAATIASSVISATVFIVAFVLRVRERGKKK